MEFKIPTQDYSSDQDLSSQMDYYGLSKLNIFNSTKRNATIQFSFNDNKQTVAQVVDRITSYSLHRNKVESIKTSQYSIDYKNLEFH